MQRIIKDYSSLSSSRSLALLYFDFPLISLSLIDWKNFTSMSNPGRSIDSNYRALTIESIVASAGWTLLEQPLNILSDLRSVAHPLFKPRKPELQGTSGALDLDLDWFAPNRFELHSHNSETLDMMMIGCATIYGDNLITSPHIISPLSKLD